MSTKVILTLSHTPFILSVQWFPASVMAPIGT